jgi:hypothetical protein
MRPIEGEKNEQTRHSQITLDYQNITFHDSRTGWALTAEDIKEFNAACTRWLIKKDPAYAKARQKKFGQL